MKKKLFYILTLSYFTANSFAACGGPINFGHQHLTNMNLGEDMDANGWKITNLVMSDVNGTVSSEATNKVYVDTLISIANSRYPTQISDAKGPVNFHAAKNACSVMDPQRSGRLPTLSELVKLCASGYGNCNAAYLWTSTHGDSNNGTWVVLKPSDGYWLNSLYTAYNYYRCVK